MSIDPATVTLSAGQSQQFTATVTGTSNPAVSWTLDAPVGTVVNGLYTAPGSVPSPQTVTVTATSQADPTRKASAVVTLTQDPTQISMVGPVTPSSGSGRSQLFQFDAQPLSGSLTWVQVLFNDSVSPAAACLVYFDPSSGSIFLSGDDSTAAANTWIGSAVLGAPGAVLSNSQCAVDAGNSYATTAGNTTSLNLSITFAAPWYGTSKMIFMAAADSAGNQASWPFVGSWDIP